MMKKYNLCVVVCLALLLAFISACGSSAGSNPGDVVGSISNNHGHEAVLTKAELDAGLAVQLDIQGTATHTHTVDLSASQVTSIKGGTQVTQTSSTTLGHSHDVTFH